MNTVFIKYIGKQSRRVDNIRHSGRVWDGEGSIIEMPLVERYSYLQYPTMFVEVTREEMEADKAANAIAAEGLDQIQKVAPSLTEDGIKAIIEKLQAELVSRAETKRNAPVKAEVKGKEPTGLEVAESNDPATAAAYSVRINKIVRILKEMDPKDKEEYTTGGVPRVRVVSDRLNFDVTSEEIQEALSVMG